MLSGTVPVTERRNMFGIGSMEFLVIVVVAVLVLGPEHLPRVTRTFARVMSEFRRVSTDFQRTMNLEANKEEWREQQAAAEAKKKKKKKKTAPKSGKAGADERAGTAATAGADERAGVDETAATAGADERAGAAPTRARAKAPAESEKAGAVAGGAASDSGANSAGGAASDMTNGAPPADEPGGQNMAAAAGNMESKA